MWNLVRDIRAVLESVADKDDWTETEADEYQRIRWIMDYVHHLQDMPSLLVSPGTMDQVAPNLLVVNTQMNDWKSGAGEQVIVQAGLHAGRRR